MPERNPLPSVGALIIRDDAIVLVQRANDPGSGLWTVPGGRIEWGETVEEAVKREVEEETGLLVEVGGLADVIDYIVADNGDIKFHYIILDYLATPVGGELRAGSDALDVRWVPFSELGTLDITPSLVDLLGRLGYLR